MGSHKSPLVGFANNVSQSCDSGAPSPDSYGNYRLNIVNVVAAFPVKKAGSCDCVHLEVIISHPHQPASVSSSSFKSVSVPQTASVLALHFALTFWIVAE